jgi:hypothetical protein
MKEEEGDDGRREVKKNKMKGEREKEERGCKGEEQYAVVD